jgi:ABC-type transport system involved in cytochrome bd biosynthesis fused ATPase/permease subunit
LRKKDIYIFDEVTANLDDETEEEILNQIISSTQGKTCIFVTHKK